MPLQPTGLDRLRLLGLEYLLEDLKLLHLEEEYIVQAMNRLGLSPHTMALTLKKLSCQNLKKTIGTGMPTKNIY